ncbi:MAG: hypothetical protein PHZ04_02910 [Patescibacteria group bacterium]|nr:hypothetical protein [Patescibacteria group bacterium]MDD5294557.1 hypothetical protein [Patescibacteria group bacterium]MDD5554654.1 hypothetical protein [Patescibacteria group bacterium]
MREKLFFCLKTGVKFVVLWLVFSVIIAVIIGPRQNWECRNYVGSTGSFNECLIAYGLFFIVGSILAFVIGFIIGFIFEFIKNHKKIENFLKSKKAFLLGLIIPFLLFAYTFSNYKDGPACGGPKGLRPCADYIDYLSSFWGGIFLFFNLLILFLSLNLIGIVYCFLNNKKKIGWTLTIIFIVVLLYIFTGG